MCAELKRTVAENVLELEHVSDQSVQLSEQVKERLEARYTSSNEMPFFQNALFIHRKECQLVQSMFGITFVAPPRENNVDSTICHTDSSAEETRAELAPHGATHKFKGVLYLLSRRLTFSLAVLIHEPTACVVNAEDMPQVVLNECVEIDTNKVLRHNVNYSSSERSCRCRELLPRSRSGTQLSDVRRSSKMAAPSRPHHHFTPYCPARFLYSRDPSVRPHTHAAYILFLPKTYLQVSHHELHTLPRGGNSAK